MARLELSAYAKLNLTLDILRRRPDGYHDLSMVMQSIDLCDTVTLTTGTGGGIACRDVRGTLPTDDSNIALRAARLFFEQTGIPCDGVAIELIKRIPVGAGMAGGSTDGAAVLRGLRQVYCPTLSQEALEHIGALVGSDVPFCVRGGTALVTGRGETVESLPPMMRCPIVVCKPDFPISTPALFGLVRVGEIRSHPDTEGVLAALARQNTVGIAARLCNVFEEILPAEYGEVGTIRRRLLSLGAQGAVMTGSGSAVFGIFPTEKSAQRATETLKSTYTQTFLTYPV